MQFFLFEGSLKKLYPKRELNSGLSTLLPSLSDNRLRRLTTTIKTLWFWNCASRSLKNQ